jgi:hypothetical protein
MDIPHQAKAKSDFFALEGIKPFKKPISDKTFAMRAF